MCIRDRGKKSQTPNNCFNSPIPSEAPFWITCIEREVCVSTGFGSIRYTSAPVSYTHLDVYKRQARFLCSIQLLMDASVFIGSITTGPSLFLLKKFYPCLLYTSDVYKRQTATQTHPLLSPEIAVTVCSIFVFSALNSAKCRKESFSGL